jgi:hypothetical protein
MRSVVRVVGVLALLGSLAGCDVETHHDGDVVSHRIGSDYFGAGGSLNLTEAVNGGTRLDREPDPG